MRGSRLKLGPALLLPLLIGLLIWGCGGSDNDDGPALTKAQFIKQGDKICEEADNQRVAHLKRWLTSDRRSALRTEAGQNAMVIEVALPSYEMELNRLAALNPPSADEDQTDPIIEGLEDAVEQVKADPGNYLIESEDIFAAANEAAVAYGYKVCSETN